MTSSSSAVVADDDQSFSYINTFHPIPEGYLPGWMLKERTRMLTDKTILPTTMERNDDTPPSPSSSSVVIYWMQRDVRTLDNWALLYAQHLAQHIGVPLHVMHVLPPPPPPAAVTTTGDDDDDNDERREGPAPLVRLRMTERYGSFLLGGLEAVHNELATQDVPLHIVRPRSADHRMVAQSIQEQVFQREDCSPVVIICDMSPLRHIRQWMESPYLHNQILSTTNNKKSNNNKKKTGGSNPPTTASSIPVWQIDAHNVVPVWYASPKREVGARTLRSKLNKLVQDCLQYKDYGQNRIPQFVGNTDHHPTMKVGTTTTSKDDKFKYDEYKSFLQWDETVGTVDWAKPGTDGALARFNEFITKGLPQYDKLRNDPNYGTKICSSLSPWLNFGHVGFATLLRKLQPKEHNRDSAGKQSFIEEGFVRKELSDNFLWYTPGGYDRIDGAAAGWAQETLETHATDVREYVYTLPQLEMGMTHDDLWNAAQLQVVQTGKLHGFMRMYWAKKVLEWTTSPQQALDYAQYLNDYYALDGRDPNGFVGVGWSIMGIHDQGWMERPIFGKIRYMNYKGCQRKFKVDQFVAKYPPAFENAQKWATTSNNTVSTRVVGDGTGTSTSRKRKEPTTVDTTTKKNKKGTK